MRSSPRRSERSQISRKTTNFYVLKISDKLAKCTQMYRYSCRKRKSLTFLFYRILTWDRERCAQLAETKRKITNVPGNDELLCVENFGQVLEMYRKMYRNMYSKMYRKMYRKLLYILVNNFFVLRNYESLLVPLSSARRDESNITLFVRIGQSFGPPSDRHFQIGPKGIVRLGMTSRARCDREKIFRSNFCVLKISDKFSP